MILATVGTHEDPFDRLVTALDTLVADGVITEPVHIQSGYSKAAAPRCVVTPMMPFDTLQAEMAAARIVITHGGPASIMQAFAHDKVPIVVPRQSRFGEHVDDHQVRFARRMADRVLVVLEIAELGPMIREYDARVAALGSAAVGSERARVFAGRFEALCEEVLARPARGARLRPAW